jgi:3-phosphoshikimate 1-carboxyvinyltransferase
MALTIAGLSIPGETIIDTAEAANVTFPEFFDLIKACGGKLELMD